MALRRNGERKRGRRREMEGVNMARVISIYRLRVKKRKRVVQSTNWEGVNHKGREGEWQTWGSNGKKRDVQVDIDDREWRGSNVEGEQRTSIVTRLRVGRCNQLCEMGKGWGKCLYHYYNNSQYNSCAPYKTQNNAKGNLTIYLKFNEWRQKRLIPGNFYQNVE